MTSGRFRLNLRRLCQGRSLARRLSVHMPWLRNVTRWRPLRCLVFVVSACWASFASAASAPDVPFTNTASVFFEASGTQLQRSSSATLIGDPLPNNPPTGLVETQFVVPENDDGVPLGLLEVIDLDPDDVHTLTITDPRFVINGDNLSIAPGVSFNFETTTLVTLPVTVLSLIHI